MRTVCLGRELVGVIAIFLSPPKRFAMARSWYSVVMAKQAGIKFKDQGGLLNYVVHALLHIQQAAQQGAAPDRLQLLVVPPHFASGGG